MADETTTTKKKSGKGWMIGGITVLLLLAVWFAWVTYDHHSTLVKVKALLVDESEKYSPRDAEALKVMADLANEIISNRAERRTVKDYAAAQKVSYEQAIVDRVMALARSLNYLE